MAGFFDGEGSVTYGNYGRQLQISISQCAANIVALDWVCEFLDDQGINFSWATRTNNGGHEYNSIVVGAQESARKMLEEMLPYLTLKHERAIEGLKFLAAKKKAREESSVPNFTP